MAHYNYNCDLRSLVDSTGVRTDLRPELSYGENAIWEFEIFEGDHIPSDLSGLTAFRAAMDTDFSSKTEVMVRVLPENITLDGNGDSGGAGCHRLKFSGKGGWTREDRRLV